MGQYALERQQNWLCHATDNVVSLFNKWTGQLYRNLSIVCVVGQVCGARKGAGAAKCLFLRFATESTWVVAFRSPKERNIAIMAIRHTASEGYRGVGVPC